jgi:hypothetical protein
MALENKELVSVSLARLTQPEFSQCMNRQVTEIENLGSTVLTDEPMNLLLAAVKSASTDYSKSILQIQKSEFTTKLAELDDTRDRAFVGYMAALKSFSYTDDAEELDAYQKLMILTDKYKGVEKLNYEAESAELKKMLEALESAEYSAPVAKVNLASKINRIKTTNAAFNELFDIRNNDTNAKEVFDAKLLRKDLYNKYNKFADYVVTMANTFNKEPFNSALKTMNTVRSYYRDILKRREGVSKAAKAKTQTPPDKNQ